MAAILSKSFSNECPWMGISWSLFRFYWALFPMVQTTVSEHLFQLHVWHQAITWTNVNLAHIVKWWPCDCICWVVWHVSIQFKYQEVLEWKYCCEILHISGIVKRCCVEWWSFQKLWSKSSCYGTHGRLSKFYRNVHLKEHFIGCDVDC